MIKLKIYSTYWRMRSILNHSECGRTIAVMVLWWQVSLLNCSYHWCGMSLKSWSMYRQNSSRFPSRKTLSKDPYRIWQLPWIRAWSAIICVKLFELSNSGWIWPPPFNMGEFAQVTERLSKFFTKYQILPPNNHKNYQMIISGSSSNSPAVSSSV